MVKQTEGDFPRYSSANERPSVLLLHKQTFSESSIGGFAVTVRSVCVGVFLKSLVDSRTVSFRSFLSDIFRPRGKYVCIRMYIHTYVRVRICAENS